MRKPNFSPQTSRGAPWLGSRIFMKHHSFRKINPSVSCLQWLSIAGRGGRAVTTLQFGQLSTCTSEATRAWAVVAHSGSFLSSLLPSCWAQWEKSKGHGVLEARTYLHVIKATRDSYVGVLKWKYQVLGQVSLTCWVGVSHFHGQLKFCPSHQ